MQIKISHLRLIVQTISVIVINSGLFGVAVLGTSFLPAGLAVPTYSCHYFEEGIVDCFIYQLEHYLTAGWESVRFLAMAALLWAIMCVILGRFLCGWICPLGLIQDLFSRTRKFLYVRYAKLPSNLNKILGQIRYVLISLFILVSFIIGTGFVSAIYRRVLDLPACQVCPSKPVFLLLQASLRIIQWPSTLPMGWGVERAITLVTILSISIFGIGSFAIRRFWCRFCPMGGLTSLFKGFSAIHLSKEEVKCTKCGICQRVCPVQVNGVYEEKGGDVTSSSCTLCLRCVEMCPQEECLKVNLMGVLVYRSKDWLKH